MNHQLTIIPGLEGEPAGQPAQGPAFLFIVIESKYDHASF